ncbi:MAG TPA: hypothetical protein VKF40_01035 [Burkholderiales bacterium]|nr:hypothetical protein [Burkholderiales bacterium]
MMRWTAISALLLVPLAGCTPGPVSVGEQGTYFVFAANQDPLRTGRCIVRNVKRHSPELTATEGPARNAYGRDVIVADSSGVVATARADVAIILVSMQARTFDNEKFANDLVGYC